MQQMTVRVRCQHGDLSGLRGTSPTHTFSWTHSKSLSKIRIYERDKRDLSLHLRGRRNAQLISRNGGLGMLLDTKCKTPPSTRRRHAQQIRLTRSFLQQSLPELFLA